MADPIEEVPAPHVWKGKTIQTIGQLNDALCALQSAEEGAEFMAVYRAVNKHANANVGYVSGYNSPETMRRILDFTRTEHPILGVPDPADELMPRRAFRAGQEWAEGGHSGRHSAGGESK